MAFDGLLITEIFHSIQGESTQAGERFSFIRLTGCNLRCLYCDSTYAFKGGTRMNIPEILKSIETHRTKNVLLTGGEPLLQRNTLTLVKALRENGYQVSIETHGECSVQDYVGIARLIMDIKSPGSGMYRGGYLKNLPLLTSTDEIKFVLCDETDLTWAEKVISEELGGFSGTILFSTANPHPESPGQSTNRASGIKRGEGLNIRQVAERILEHKLPVRLQTQLHKLIWEPTRRGV